MAGCLKESYCMSKSELHLEAVQAYSRCMGPGRIYEYGKLQVFRISWAVSTVLPQHSRRILL